MEIRSVRIIDEKLFLKGEGRDSYLMDGVYRRDDGVSLTIRGNRIVSMLAVPDIANATKAQLEEYIDELEQKLSSLDEENKMATNEVQNALQRQAQTAQMFSNLLKMFHDVSKSIINNMR